MRGEGVGWLAALVIGCAGPGAARPDAPVAVDRAPPNAATPTVVTSSPRTPEPACAPLEVPPGLEPRGTTEASGRTHGVTPSEAVRDLGTITFALSELFAALHAARIPERLVTDDTPRPARWHQALDELVAAAPERGLCPIRLVSVRYPGGRRHRAVVGVEMRDREGPLGVAEVTLSRRGADGWQVSVVELADHLDEHARLRRAIALLRTVDEPVTSSGSADFAHIWVGAHPDRTLCVRVAATPDTPAATRCVAGRWPHSEARAHFGSDRVLCIETRPARGRQSTWLLRWPDGAPHQGRCDRDPPRFGAVASELTIVSPPFDLAPLGGVAVSPRDPGVTVLAGLSITRVCLGAGPTLTCSPAMTHDALFLDVDFTDPVVALDPNGDGWLVIRRYRSESGAEAQAGEAALAVFRLEDGRLAPRGFLPLGGHAAARIEHDPEVRTVWQTSRVHHERVDVDATGCITIGRQLATEQLTVRRRPRPRVLRESRLEPRPRTPDHLDGEELDEIYAAIEMDSSGHWRPSADGGFERVASCR